MKRLFVSALLMMFAVTPAYAASAKISNPFGLPSGPSGAIEIAHIPKCIEAAPAAIGIPLNAPPITLTVRALIEGVSLANAQAAMTRAADAYTSLGINLVVDQYQDVSFTGVDAQGLINQSRAKFFGNRPSGVDVVYLLTDKNISASGQTAVAGLADCIGGVAFQDRAFAVGEARVSQFNNSLFSYELPAKIAAHELGHLLGAHHHYANCVEGIAASDVGGDLGSPCSLMFNDVGFMSLKFSTLNGLVVRGHAEEYA